ncbi:MAG: hypothetical protein Q8Q09_23080 [Deltaproteobacteria bacterium]|nr:hypothetical protein [Deltaproteobacteria bacterium]
MVKRAGVAATVAALEHGSISFGLIDDDGEALGKRWSYEWTGRDPFELALFAITELSGKPWKWSVQRRGRAKLNIERARAMSIRAGQTLRKEKRKMTAVVVGRIVQHECLRSGDPQPDLDRVEKILAGKIEIDWEAGAADVVPAALRAFRQALRAAADAECGLDVMWGDVD